MPPYGEAGWSRPPCAFGRAQTVAVLVILRRPGRRRGPGRCSDFMVSAFVSRITCCFRIQRTAADRFPFRRGFGVIRADVPGHVGYSQRHGRSGESSTSIEGALTSRCCGVCLLGCCDCGSKQRRDNVFLHLVRVALIPLVWLRCGDCPGVGLPSPTAGGTTAARRAARAIAGGHALYARAGGIAPPLAAGA